VDAASCSTIGCEWRPDPTTDANSCMRDVTPPEEAGGVMTPPDEGPGEVMTQPDEEPEGVMEMAVAVAAACPPATNQVIDFAGRPASVALVSHHASALQNAPLDRDSRFLVLSRVVLLPSFNAPPTDPFELSGPRLDQPLFI
jgi:hypothetical protein